MLVDVLRCSRFFKAIYRQKNIKQLNRHRQCTKSYLLVNMTGVFLGWNYKFCSMFEEGRREGLICKGWPAKWCWYIFVILELDTPGNCRVASATRRTYRDVIRSTGPSEKSARDESARCKTKPRQRVQRQCRKSRCLYTFSLYRYSFNMLVKYVV